MDPPRPDGREQSARPGLRAGISKTLGALAALAAARSELFAAEAGEAGRRLALMALGLFAAAVLAAAGWMLFTVALCFLAARWLAVSPAVTGAALGLLHLLAAAGAAGFVFRRRAPLFKETINQFRKDREWLSGPGKNGGR